MASNFWRIVNEVLEKADIILLVGDSRAPDKSFNIEVIHKCKKLNKKIIKILNKVDLLTKKEQDKLQKDYPDIITISATKHWSTMRLLRLINKVAEGEKSVVGVLGYPNTGKSSIINAIRGRGSAPVSSVSGYTKGKQIIRVTQKIKLIDTPGVIPYQEQDDLLHAIISAKSPEQIKDVEDIAMGLLEYAKGRIEKFYGVKKIDDYDETLDNVAVKKNLLKKGGKPDQKAAAIRIIHDWQKHKIK